jgi:hypothetical protein
LLIVLVLVPHLVVAVVSVVAVFVILSLPLAFIVWMAEAGGWPKR